MDTNKNSGRFSRNYSSRSGAITKTLDRRAWQKYVSTVFLSLLFVVAVAVLSAVASSALSARADSGTPVNVWWPVESTPVMGTQPFKAMISGMNVEQYDMYWQVDGGQLNGMYNSYQDYPHKEASVNVSGWNWKGSGPYVINFVAKQGGNIIAQHSLQLRLNNAQPAPQVSQPQVTTQPLTQPTTQTQNAVTAVVSVLAAAPVVQAATVTPTPTPTTVSVQAPTTQPVTQSTYYVNPYSPAATQATAWRSSRPADASMMDILAAQPQATWLGNWNSNVQADTEKVASAAHAKNATAVFVAYNIPGRDCGGYSAGGTVVEQYAAWIRSVASGIGSAKAVVILEPDAIAGISCLSLLG
jgi:hypothetical protein